MIAAGLNSMSELDALEELEKKEEDEKRAQAERAAAVEELLAQPTPPADPNFDLFAYDPSLDLYSATWLPVDVGGRTSQASQGS
jgi:hypothetical protein